MFDNEKVTSNARRASAKFVCALVSNNDAAQVKLCEIFSFTPFGGLVSINKMPQSVIQHAAKLSYSANMQ